ncbi:MAG TPA: bifunctional 5,10-methylenetetrahydrofolate dehydrogenase/5,10-methenyltetrahydrofolate cyclohydrolase [Candidatus Nealsonbacteria bacterium]|uniref:Methenyltetrahydrofolate cyclohydrolase n=1 Tax=marine sediment metagenome TaxID=412755 RepID=A0A0F9X3S1_9ZZZZ|nr:bifunctional 5,10-methylenetetrahydrofolate dehydrogenase/5,10-methenyltetrahydrofolate cyclohydrolase [Candidatus Nealsonbacteria bacterium]HEB46430.1 bifunctional 5,10-methylenetetrahydrofolate dehydrogenase/5,10-methenyltetrahydrofolate cyclohydrolase [Candidatus Nealsonbacteria bacterium]
MTKILDGKKLAGKISDVLRKEIKKSNLRLRLAVVLVGEEPVSKIFISQKKKFCENTGVNFRLYNFPKKISQNRLQKEVRRISKNSKNSGVIIQLPLPKNIDTNKVLNLIPSRKDVDVLSTESLGRFYQGTSKILPPVVKAISYLFTIYNLRIKRKNVVLIGSGKLTGLPLTLWILKKGGTLTVINKFTPNISSFTKKADILISGVGKSNLITAKMTKRGVIVIDCGSSYLEGKLVGDVDFKSVSKKTSYITPVPGGVGPLTVAFVIKNLVNLNK